MDMGGTISNSAAFVENSIKVSNGNYVNAGGFGGITFASTYKNNASQIGEDIISENNIGVVNLGGFGGSFRTTTTVDKSTSLVFGDIRGETTKGDQPSLSAGFIGRFQGSSPDTSIVSHSADYVGGEIHSANVFAWSGGAADNLVVGSVGWLINAKLNDFTVLGQRANADKEDFINASNYVGLMTTTSEFSDNYFVEVGKGTRTSYPITLDDEGNPVKGAEIAEIEIAGRAFQDKYWGEDAAEENTDLPYSNFDYVSKNDDNIALQGIATGLGENAASPFETITLGDYSNRHLSLWSGTETTPGPIYDILGIPAGIPPKVDVTFDLNYMVGESPAGIHATKTVFAGSAIGASDFPADPSRLGYTFKGWNTKADGSGEAFAGDSVVTDALTVHAQWELVTVDVDGSKTWDDNNDQDGMRPASITINLLENGTKIDSKVVTAADSWAWSFKNLPKYKEGSLVTYTITEDPIANYSTTISGYDVTNTHTPAKTSVQVSTTWDDGNDQDGVRPLSTTIKLFADGVDTGKTLTLTPGNSWTDTFTGLDEYKAGAKINYTIQEVAIGNGYTTVISGDAQAGYVVTNSRTPETISVAGKKTWDDKNDQDGKRPKSIKINLLSNGIKIDSKTVTKKDGWKWNFANLPKYKSGTEITYTITEDKVAEYSGKANGYNIKNVYTPGKTSVPVTITWDDGNDRDGIRPKRVKVKLIADGKDTGKTLVLTDEGNWSDTFTVLDEYKDGKKINYTIGIVPVVKYASTISGDPIKGFVVNNRHALKNTKTGDSGSDTTQTIKPTVTAGKTISKADQPKTGDEGLTGFWIGLMLISVFGFVVFGKRKLTPAKADKK